MIPYVIYPIQNSIINSQMVYEIATAVFQIVIFHVFYTIGVRISTLRFFIALEFRATGFETYIGVFLNFVFFLVLGEPYYHKVRIDSGII